MKGSIYEAYQYCVREDEETKKEVGRYCIYQRRGGNERTVCSLRLRVELCDWAMQGDKGGPSVPARYLVPPLQRQIMGQHRVQDTYTMNSHEPPCRHPVSPQS